MFEIKQRNDQGRKKGNNRVITKEINYERKRIKERSKNEDKKIKVNFSF